MLFIELAFRFTICVSIHMPSSHPPASSADFTSPAIPPGSFSPLVGSQSPRAGAVVERGYLLPNHPSSSRKHVNPWATFGFLHERGQAAPVKLNEVFSQLLRRVILWLPSFRLYLRAQSWRLRATGSCRHSECEYEFRCARMSRRP